MYTYLTCIIAMFSSVHSYYFKKYTERTLPVGWDDPFIRNEFQLLIDVFNKAGREILNRSFEIPKTIPLITINEENL